VIWGESDRIVDVAYGRAFARAFAHGRFELVPKAGHMPHLEQPERVLALLRGL
jgi:pimeloyl-ACP methyl ester carboxylesterase